EPALIAHHYTEAHRDEPAVTYWHKAADVSKKRFALQEMITNLQKGLNVAGRIADGRARNTCELDLRRELVPALFAEHGWAAQQVRDELERAWEVARSVGTAENLLPILNGLWVYHLTNGNLDESLRWANQMATTAADGRDPLLEISAHRSLMASHF